MLWNSATPRVPGPRTVQEALILPGGHMPCALSPAPAHLRAGLDCRSSCCCACDAPLTHTSECITLRPTVAASLARPCVSMIAASSFSMPAGNAAGVSAASAAARRFESADSTRGEETVERRSSSSTARSSARTMFNASSPCFLMSRSRGRSGPCRTSTTSRRTADAVRTHTWRTPLHCACRTSQPLPPPHSETH